MCQTIRELGGTIPENLPVAKRIKKVENRAEKGIAKSGRGITACSLGRGGKGVRRDFQHIAVHGREQPCM